MLYNIPCFSGLLILKWNPYSHLYISKWLKTLEMAEPKGNLFPLG